MTKLLARVRLSANKLTAVFIQKLTYSRGAQMLFGLFSIGFLLLLLVEANLVYGLCFGLSFLPLVGALLMKPFDGIIVISRVTGSPHVLIRDRDAISTCFEGDRLNPIKLLKLIKRSMYRYLYEYAVNSKRRFITTYAHQTMFKNLGLAKLDFITDVEEIRAGIVRDRLLFVSFEEIWKAEDVGSLLRKVPYYRFKVDIGLLRDHVNRTS